MTHAVGTGHQFLIDVAHAASPVSDFGQPLQADSDNGLGLSNGVDENGQPISTSGFYDNELLDAHFIAGDGRVNENIGLTAVHEIFMPSTTASSSTRRV